jgi:hypothetical protein
MVREGLDAPALKFFVRTAADETVETKAIKLDQEQAMNLTTLGPSPHDES